MNLNQPFQVLLELDSLPKLLRFLERELHWPISSEDVEDVTFQYEPSELGLKPEHAPKIKAIYQIRPPTKDTPWGIFFINFENKKLPVTLMRRILNHLRVKKRGPQVGPGWNAEDLLFMTTYGEEVAGTREVAFAHFHQQAGDLPTLNVLQWDAQDTPVKLQQTLTDLRQNLGWPPDTTDQNAWKSQWSKPFRHGLGHTIKTAKGLAEALAELSTKIKVRCNELLEAETDKGPLTKLYKAFQAALMHDLKPIDFADTFAQTVTYGLLTAAISRTPEPASGHGTTLLSEDAAAMVPVTNPFLQEVLQTFIDVGGRKKGGMDFDELGVQDVVELLRGEDTDLGAVIRDFGNRKPGEDPVIHFYEDYLKAFNKEQKVKRGVFYTPQPVVSYIVRSVHELLQTEFGLEDGLASTITWGEMAAKNPEIKIPEFKDRDGKVTGQTDRNSHFVTILDPATGTATFLVEVIDVIWKHLAARWERDRAGTIALLRTKSTPSTFVEFWNEYVPDHLLPRLYGYELMMAPYAIAHMKVGLKLGETGYKFRSSQRVRIYLTNALEPASELQARLALDWEALAHEAQAVKAVKETERFTVVIGNPPYSGVSSNMTPEAQRLIDSYKFVDGVPLNERKHWLQDDYVKFIRIAQAALMAAGTGILGFITNHGYLDNPTFRGMRRSLMQSFGTMRFLNLHGNAKKKEVALDGSKDENVFDIQQGVAICLLSPQTEKKPCQVFRADLYGLRQAKYAQLGSSGATSTNWCGVEPNSPFFLFAPLDQTDRAEYEHGWLVPDIMPLNSAGFITARDHFVVDIDEQSLVHRIKEFADPSLSEVEVRRKFFEGRGADKYPDGDTRGWKVPKARQLIQNDDTWSARTKICLYRPFDFRYVYWAPWMIDWPRPEVMTNLLSGPNTALITSRLTKGESFQHVLATSKLSEVICLSPKTSNNGFVFPLYRHPTEKEVAMGIGKEPNLSPAFLDALAGALGRRFESGSSTSGDGGLFAGGHPLVRPEQPSLSAFGDGLGSAQGRLVTAPDPAVHPEGPSFSPEDVFQYIYAVLHSPTYRTRYAEFLKIDFPRIPLPGGPEVFDALVPLGEKLVSLHLMEHAKPDAWATTYRGLASPVVEKVSYANGTVWLDKAQTVGFQGVPETTWNFHIGGYQVCEKWLKDRGPKKGKPGRTLTPEDIEHYHYIVFALTETQRLMCEIDEAIEAHGGWPGAFSTGEAH